MKEEGERKKNETKKRKKEKKTPTIMKIVEIIM